MSGAKIIKGLREAAEHASATGRRWAVPREAASCLVFYNITLNRRRGPPDPRILAMFRAILVLKHGKPT